MTEHYNRRQFIKKMAGVAGLASIGYGLKQANEQLESMAVQGVTMKDSAGDLVVEDKNPDTKKTKPSTQEDIGEIVPEDGMGIRVDEDIVSPEETELFIKKEKYRNNEKAIHTSIRSYLAGVSKDGVDIEEDFLGEKFDFDMELIKINPRMFFITYKNAPVAQIWTETSGSMYGLDGTVRVVVTKGNEGVLIHNNVKPEDVRAIIVEALHKYH